MVSPNTLGCLSSVMDQVDKWRNIIKGDSKSWVMFEYGTIVILMKPANDLKKQGKEIMKKWGQVIIGTPSADMEVVGLDNDGGWVVSGHHPDMLNYVGINEVGVDVLDLGIGLIGREKRRKDAECLNITHVEDKRS